MLKANKEFKGKCYICREDMFYVSKTKKPKSKRLCSSECSTKRRIEVEEFKEAIWERRKPIESRFEILDL